MSAAISARTFAGYRAIFRARKVAFANDARALKESRVLLKSEFLKNATVSEPGQLQELYAGVNEVVDMLKSGVIQGKIDNTAEKPVVQVKIRKDQGLKMEKDGITSIENLGGGDFGGKDEGKSIDELVLDKGGKD